MFETLFMRTCVILAGSLLMAFIGSQISVKITNNALQTGNVNTLQTSMWTAICINIIAFLLLIFFKSNIILSFIFMFFFTLSSGFTLGIYAFSAAPGVAQKAIMITALTTLITGLIASYPGMDFAWLGNFLFIGLIILIIISVIRIFVKIKGSKSRLISGAGVLIFTGYLLYDFNNLSKLKNVAQANNWQTALDFAVNIYLDIINLLMYLIDLLSSSNN